MADSFDDVQLKAIDDAYSDKIKSLFANLFTSLLPGGKPSEQKLGIEEFALGLRVAQQARELAIKLATGSKPGSAHDKPTADVA